MPKEGETTTRSTLRLLGEALIRLCFGTVLSAGILFLTAGSLDWPMAWVYIGLGFVGLSVTWLLIARIHPDLLAERAHIGEGAKGWDKVLAGLMGLGVLLPTQVIAGLDHRFCWSGLIPVAVEIAGALLFVLAVSLVAWAMASNRFFSSVVRIQTDRGHTVATTGPYQIVRHPGYVGIMASGIAVPLMLGSLWALVPAMAGWILVVLRTIFEDRTLRNELEGYKEYASRVRYRLMPGVW